MVHQHICRWSNSKTLFSYIFEGILTPCKVQHESTTQKQLQLNITDVFTYYINKARLTEYQHINFVCTELCTASDLQN